MTQQNDNDKHKAQILSESMSTILTAEKGEARRKQALIATGLQNAFLDWLTIPDTLHQLDSILAAVVAEQSQSDKQPMGSAVSTITDVTPSTRLIDRSKAMSPVSSELEFVPSIDRLPPSPAPDLGSPQKLSSTVSDDVDVKNRDSAPSIPPASTIKVVDVGSSTETLKEGEIPKFWYPDSTKRPPVGQNTWTDQVAALHWSIFDPDGTKADAEPKNLFISFTTFEMKIVREILKLSRYMACCILCMINGGTLEEDLTQVITTVIPAASNVAANSAESADSSFAHSPHSEGGPPNTTNTATSGPTDNHPVLNLANWKEFWQSKRLMIDNEVWNFFAIIKEDVNDFIWGHNFQPFLQELLERHPGVEFLKPTPEFQKRYAETVIARILYDLDSMSDHRITYSQLAKSSLAHCWRLIDDESDFNTIREFFSYEHFYVAYCRFWALDVDHDFRLDKSDLVKYDNHAFSTSTLNRLFSEAGSIISDGHTISYEGFFYLLMHDEDKTTDRAIEFWFRLVDLDGDGVLRYHELAHFYCEQLVRLESRTMEAPSFEVILCQLNDMIRPQVSCEFKLRDLKRQRRHAPLFFNTLLSLTKFLAWEHRDPFIQKTEFLEFPCFTEWDRFCHLEYEKLSAEDLSEEVSVGEMGEY
eukprot:Blabericola_migrator_1__7700@NODE_392_length_9038_cov_131_832349_g80_i1_p1_GENE_NODE_392_length_9038_cov_131_832349_g80_i1NODE_392_length_9038_cov_131_832349_g80_i1_p1_ORF_typecomplete_len644_score89_69EFhand_13/PF17958_1/2_1e24EFhand_7/PF13499_6/6_9e02EFhand_7/PF13499_6/1_1e10SPARC_Ca_bdg/PF10591_9/1e03SPARC_Ca_bdg/PF10591_9/77SPARC_Ca_bdg/PF10591_9/0_19EFhand_1/PF00036_32/0_0097EFhand_8/PF13833_6/7_4e02EFhand_8/PF13833_6/0_094EFhand_5/PF13202_6/1_8e03EFhand_5/PF13202_6/0_19_NODE_392_length_903